MFYDGNQQYVTIDGNSSAQARVIYNRQDMQPLKIQVGFCQVDRNWVLVWRPYDAEDISHNAEWRDGVWKSIYSLRMARNDADGKVKMAIGEFEFEGSKLALPLAQPVLTYDLKEHLSKLDMIS